MYKLHHDMGPVSGNVYLTVMIKTIRIAKIIENKTFHYFTCNMTVALRVTLKRYFIVTDTLSDPIICNKLL